jgi:hypothetical protein
VEFATWLAIGRLLRRLPEKDSLRVHQELADAFKPTMPIIGGVGMLASLAGAATLWSRDDPAALAWVASVVLLGISIAITAGHNDRINREVARWDRDRPPADWGRLKTSWVRANFSRTFTLVAAFTVQVGVIAVV